MAIVSYIAVDNSTIWDVALNTYGTLDKLVKLMEDNNFPNTNTYPVAGQIFFFDDTLVANENNLQSNLSPRKFATRGGVGGTLAPNNTTMGVYYSEDFAAEYVSNVDGTTTVNFAGIIPIGAKIVLVGKEIRPINSADYAWNPSSAFMSLLHGITVDNGQTLFVIYKIIQTS